MYSKEITAIENYFRKDERGIEKSELMSIIDNKDFRKHIIANGYLKLTIDKYNLLITISRNKIRIIHLF